MRVSRFLAILYLAATASGFAQTRVSRIHLFIEQPRLISGQQTLVLASARNSDGSLRASDQFSWRSNNTNIATVDANGLVTARGLGVTEIAASLTSLSASVRIQVLPLRIDVSPSSKVVIVGDQFQFRASALNVDLQPIPGVTFLWQVIGAGGFQTQAARIDNTGVLSASAVGRFTVVASINYPAGQGQFAPQVSGSAAIDVRAPASYRLTRLLSSDEVLPSASLRPPTGSHKIAVNDAGQVAFNASLNGMTSGLMLYDRGVFDLLVGAGTLGPLPGGTIMGMEPPVINSRGDVLTLAGIDGQPGIALVLASRQGKSFVLLEGESAGGFENLRLCCGRGFDLNDNGDIAFGAQFQWANIPLGRNGLFVRSESGLELAWWEGEPLPGLEGVLGVNEIGIDRAGTVYFRAWSGTGNAIYRRERAQSPVKVIGTGDSFAGSTVRSIYDLANAADGTLAFVLEVDGGQMYLSRKTAVRTENVALRWWGNRLAIASNGSVAFVADTGAGSALYRWESGNPSLILAEGGIAPNGEPIRSINAVAITADGRVYADVATVDNQFVVVRAAPDPMVLFQAGSQVNVTANITINGLASGSDAGEPYVLLGGGRANLFSLNPRGPIPRLLNGDRLPDRSIFDGIDGISYQSSQGLYFSSAGNIYRLAGGRAEVVMAHNTSASDGVLLSSATLLSVSENGFALVRADTDRQHQRLLLLANGRTTVLAYSVGNPLWQTTSPAGGVVRNLGWPQAVDSLGRVMTYLAVNGGPSGLFLHENGNWIAAALMDVTRVNNQTITRVSQLEAANGRFYAILNLSGGQNVLAEYRDREWIPLVTNADTGPNGAEINFIGNFAVNRQGDIAFAAGFRGGMNGLVFRGADRVGMIQTSTVATEDGDYIMGVTHIVLGDDRRVYFRGRDIKDRTVVYVAEPLF